MSENNYDEMDDEKRIRQQVEKQFKEREGLIIHSVIFLMINALLWMIYFFLISPEDRGFPWPLIVTLGWGSGMVAHVITYYNQFGGGALRREEAVQREIERYRESRAYEKPKNEKRPHMELTADGEIEEVYEDDVVPRERQNRR